MKKTRFNFVYFLLLLIGIFLMCILLDYSHGVKFAYIENAIISSFLSPIMTLIISHYDSFY